jgi:hypothetical protein
MQDGNPMYLATPHISRAVLLLEFAVLQAGSAGSSTDHVLMMQLAVLVQPLLAPPDQSSQR